MPGQPPAALGACGQPSTVSDLAAPAVCRASCSSLQWWTVEASTAKLTGELPAANVMETIF